MPNAEVNIDVTERIELKSLPGAFVVLRPVSFGQKLTRRDRATKMSMELAERSGDDSNKVDVEFLNRWTRAFDFQNCIVDHNLELSNGQKMDFGNPTTLDVLDPRVGSEIETHIDKLLGDDDDLEDFSRLSTTSSKGDPDPTTDT